MNMKYTIDAQGKKLGRIASQAALYLRGKGSASYVPNELSDAQVEIVNASKLEINEKRGVQTVYLRYSGYPGGLRETKLAEFITKKGHAELLRKVILGMLPRNRQRSRLIKHLTVKP
ncbi:MAG: 50S ribosomal protein L13 [Parcubacteria group bacterium GW2011_GWA2_49_9]|nr:MAG: 50S ribosomal protein L13 [Parcubacteria group bacterium GW2011_GWA2_49_9]